MLRDTLGDALDQLIGTSDFSPLLKAAIGFDAEKRPGDLLSEYILTEIETSSARWSDHVEQDAEQVTDTQPFEIVVRTSPDL